MSRFAHLGSVDEPDIPRPHASSGPTLARRGVASVNGPQRPS